MAMSGRFEIERSSGDVFTDLGFPKAEARNLMVRSQLMSEIREVARSMTKAKAAERFRITHARLEDLSLVTDDNRDGLSILRPVAVS